MDKCDTTASIKLESCTYWEPICSRQRDADEGNGNGRCSMCILRHLLRGRHWADRPVSDLLSAESRAEFVHRIWNERVQLCLRIPEGDNNGSP